MIVLFTTVETTLKVTEKFNKFRQIRSRAVQDVIAKMRCLLPSRGKCTKEKFKVYIYNFMYSFKVVFVRTKGLLVLSDVRILPCIFY